MFNIMNPLPEIFEKIFYTLHYVSSTRVHLRHQIFLNDLSDLFLNGGKKVKTPQNLCKPFSIVFISMTELEHGKEPTDLL